MLLKAIQYREFIGLPKEWSTPVIQLANINLFVGKNGTGKTRLLNVMASLGGLLAGKSSPAAYQSGHYFAEFDDSPNHRKFMYEVQYEEQKVIREILKIDKKTYINRVPKGKTTLHHARPDGMLEVQPPPGQLIATTRRDQVQHPYLENLFTWGHSVRHYRFGLDLGIAIMEVIKNEPSVSQNQFQAANDANIAQGVFRYGMEKNGPDFKRKIIDDFNSLGYRIEDIGIDRFLSVEAKIGNTISNPLMLYVKESDLKSNTFHAEMSTGMSRALALLILVSVNISEKSASSIFVDDIGEGLDYQRAVSLIKLLIKKAETSSTQLVMATNDRFVMNEVPLDYWNVIVRDGPVMKIFNQKTAKQQFDGFKGLGLSNFDFFSSEAFLETKSADKKTSAVRRRSN